MTKDHIQENKIWRLIRILSLIGIIISLIIVGILLVSGKITKLYSCNIDPDEQYYSKFFVEESEVKKEYLDNFHKFCIDELPVQILANNSQRNNTDIIFGLSNGTEYIVPKGEIWMIEYIGKKMSFSDEILSVKQELSDIQEIQSIAKDIAKSHKYKINEFDCTDFTYSLVGNLTKEGYNARCIIGYKKQNPKQVFHAWTEVNLSGEIIWIESTTGEIVTEENKPYYKPLKGFKKYQCY